MPTEFQRPTPAELVARIASDIEGALIGVNARLRSTVEYVLARTLAGVFHGVHGHLAWVAEQIIVDQAVERFVVRWGDLFGVVRNQASKSHRTLTVLGTGGTMTAGTVWTRLADGFSFTTDSIASSVTSSAVPITAVLGGAIGNMEIGETVSLSSPIAGITGTATVTALGVDGADLETIPDLLLRILDRIQHPPLGGAPGDYVTWAKQVAGVTRAWEYRGVDGVGNPGLGKVAVTFVMDGNEDIIPGAPTVAAVQAWLDEHAPAQVYVFAPTPVPFDYELIANPNTPAVQAAIEAEVADMIGRDAIPGDSRGGGTVYLSRFNEAVSAAQGEVSHTTVSPTEDKVHAFGEIAVPGTATFSTAP